MGALEDLVARQAIGQCSIDYMRGLDRLDAAAQGAAFHDDATVDYGFFSGKAADFVSFAQDLLRRYEKTLHMLGQVDISLSGDGRTADGEVYFSALHRTQDQDGAQDLMIAGRYRDRYEFRDGRWAIVNRIEIVDWTRTDPARDDWFVRTPAAITGSRGNPQGIADRKGEKHD